MRAVIVDPRDAPLSATEETLCLRQPERVLRGLGLVGLEHPQARLVVAGTSDASDALLRAGSTLGAKLSTDVPEGPSLRLRPSTLVERVESSHHVLSIAGAVHAPRVTFVDPRQTVGALVDATLPAWVALWGDEEVDRRDSIGALVAARPSAARLLLVLPARHAKVRRARTPLSATLRQLRSACASCNACAPACPSGIAVPSLLRALSTSRRARVPLAELATAARCTGCGACDLACPVALSPMRLVVDVARRMNGVVPPATVAQVVPQLDPVLAQARLGLARYRRPPTTLSAPR